MTFDLNAVGTAITGTREGLEASGFAIDCTGQDERLVFTLRALEGACEDCLVPKAVFTSILARELANGGIATTAIDVVYPAGMSGSGLD